MKAIATSKTTSMTLLIHPYIAHATFVTLGYSIEKIANICAEQIAHQSLRQTDQPKQMLGIFYKSMALKWTLFTILTMLAIIHAPNHAHYLLLGIAISVLAKSRLTKLIEKHEPHHTYSN